MIISRGYCFLSLPLVHWECALESIVSGQKKQPKIRKLVPRDHIGRYSTSSYVYSTIVSQNVFVSALQRVSWRKFCSSEKQASTMGGVVIRLNPRRCPSHLHLGLSESRPNYCRRVDPDQESRQASKKQSGLCFVVRWQCICVSVS